MPSCDVNAVTRLAEASWWRDNGHCAILKWNDFVFNCYTMDYNHNVRHPLQKETAAV